MTMGWIDRVTSCHASTVFLLVFVRFWIFSSSRGLILQRSSRNVEKLRCLVHETRRCTESANLGKRTPVEHAGRCPESAKYNLVLYCKSAISTIPQYTVIQCNPSHSSRDADCVEYVAPLLIMLPVDFPAVDKIYRVEWSGVEWGVMECEVAVTLTAVIDRKRRREQSRQHVERRLGV